MVARVSASPSLAMCLQRTRESGTAMQHAHSVRNGRTCPCPLGPTGRSVRDCEPGPPMPGLLGLVQQPHREVLHGDRRPARLQKCRRAQADPARLRFGAADLQLLHACQRDVPGSERKVTRVIDQAAPRCRARSGRRRHRRATAAPRFRAAPPAGSRRSWQFPDACGIPDHTRRHLVTPGRCLGHHFAESP